MPSPVISLARLAEDSFKATLAKTAKTPQQCEKPRPE